jgi:hypothetical protein
VLCWATFENTFLLKTHLDVCTALAMYRHGYVDASLKRKGNLKRKETLA